MIFLICSISIALTQTSAEEIFGYLPTNSGVSFQVKSGGCTHNKDFIFELRRDQFFRVVDLTIVRVRPDFCFGYLPMGVKLTFSYEDLSLVQGEKFLVVNPIRNPQVGHPPYAISGN